MLASARPRADARRRDLARPPATSAATARICSRVSRTVNCGDQVRDQADRVRDRPVTASGAGHGRCAS